MPANVRSSKFVEWAEGVGARAPHEEASDTGFAYYTRYFRATNGDVPRAITGALTALGSFSLLTLYGDARTWSVTVFISSRDKAMKPVVQAEKWTALVDACTLHKQFLDGEPITDVLPMARIVDRYRRLVVGGEPVALRSISKAQTGSAFGWYHFDLREAQLFHGLTGSNLAVVALHEITHAVHHRYGIGTGDSHRDFKEAQLKGWFGIMTGCPEAWRWLAWLMSFPQRARLRALPRDRVQRPAGDRRNRQGERRRHARSGPGVSTFPPGSEDPGLQFPGM